MTYGIYVSLIAPADYLERFVAQDPPTVHYVAAQRVLANLDYRRFYRTQAEMGAFLILDNGVFDLGQSISVEDLRRAATMIKAHEIVLPDVINDGAATVSSSSRAAREYHRLADSVRLCAVVQGATNSDWLHCYESFCKAKYVDSIALPSPKHDGHLTGVAFSRLVATQYLEKQEMIQSRITYRLLGLGDSGHLELKEQRRHEWLQTVDSSSPVVLGALGIAICDGKPYQKPAAGVEQVPTIPEANHSIIRQNIRVIRSAAGCPLKIATPKCT
jgi:hypothetical protein